MSEIETIKRCQQEELSSFSLLYDQYVRLIYQFIYFKTQHKETAEDLTSTTFMKALESISQFDSQKGSFKTWLYQIARNSVIDHYRAFHSTSDLNDFWDISSPENVKDQVDKNLEWQKVGKYLKKLKPEQREIILLRLWSDLPFAEIAEIMGKSEPNCKMMFKRSLEELKANLPNVLSLLLFFYPFN